MQMRRLNMSRAARALGNAPSLIHHTVPHHATPPVDGGQGPPPVRRIAYHQTVSSLTRLPDELAVEALQAQVEAANASLMAHRAALARTRAELESFRISYRRQVGLLHEELDALELKIAEAELGELAKRLEERGAPSDAVGDTRPAPENAPRFTTDGVRKLFRDVARSIHPDLAHDEAARARRHLLMVEANRAYAVGDEARLRGILQAWEQSPEAVVGMDDAATRLRLVRRLAEIDAERTVLDGELADLQRTSLWRLKVLVDEATARGGDLVADMVRRLKRDIVAARNRLDAMTWRPLGV